MIYKWFVISFVYFQVEENKVESIKKDKAATEKLLQETIEKHQIELASQKEYYTNALNAAKEAEALAEARVNNEARTELESRLREAEERESMLVQALEELRQTLSRKEQQVLLYRLHCWFCPADTPLVKINILYYQFCRQCLEKTCFAGTLRIFKNVIKCVKLALFDSTVMLYLFSFVAIILQIINMAFSLSRRVSADVRS